MKKILLSLHDTTPAFEREIDLICGRFDELGAFRRTLLIVPDYLRKTPLKECPAWCRKIASLRDSGSDIGLHGIHHEYAECGFLSESKAMSLLGESRERFCDAFGFAPTGFVAPQWFQSGGCKRALTRLGFLYSGRWTGLFNADGKCIHPAFPTNYDWGMGLLDSFFAWWNPKRLLAKNNGIIRMSFHPMDVRHGLFEQEADLLRKLMENGWQVQSYGDAANEEKRG